MGIWHLQRIGKNRVANFDGVQAFYVNALFRALVFALIGIFTPVFIYQTMIMVLETGRESIIAVAVFYLIVRAVVVIGAFPISKLIEKIGFRWSVLISAGFLSAYVAGLYLAFYGWCWLVFAAIMLGFNIIFYWISRNSVIAIDSKNNSVGKQIGTLSMIESGAGILGPVVGGLVIAGFGYRTLYMIAFVVLAFSVIPLFAMGHHVHRNGVSLKGYLYWVRDRRYFHQAVSYIGKGMDDYGWGLLWPLALSFILINPLKMGEIFSFLAVTSVVVRFISGYVFDKLYKKRGYEDEWLFASSSVLNSALWLVRIFLTTAGQVFWVEATIGNAGTVYRNISEDYSILAGKRMSEIAYAVYREITYSIGVIILMLVMILGAIYGIWKEAIFIVIAFWSLVAMIQARESNL